MGITSAFKGFEIVGRDSVLVKEEHTVTWSGTNGINTTPTLTYHTSTLKYSNRMKTVKGSPMGEVGFHFQDRGFCNVQYETNYATCSGTWTQAHFEYTTNGTTWTQGVMPSTGNDDEYTDITYSSNHSKWYLCGDENIYVSSGSSLPTSTSDWSVVHSGIGEDMMGIDCGELVHNGVTTFYIIAAGDGGQSCYSTNGTSWTNFRIHLYTGSQNWNKHNYTDVYFHGGSVFVYGKGRRASHLKHATDPTAKYDATNAPGGWRNMDTSDAFGYGAYNTGEIKFANGQIYSHFQNSGFGITSRHIARTTLSDIKGRANAWTVIENEDDAENQSTQNGSYQHPDFGALEYINGHWFGAGVKSALYTYNSSIGYTYSSDSYEPFYCYSLDNMATFTFVYQGFSGTLMRPDNSMMVNNLFIVSDYYQHNESWWTNYPQSGFGNGGAIQATHDIDKDVYSTPGVEGDTISVTFDTFYATNPITYSGTPGSSSSVQQDLDLFNALTKALADGDLGGVTITNLGSGNGIKIINQVQGSYVNPTVSGNSATCTVNTTLDN